LVPSRNFDPSADDLDAIFDRIGADLSGSGGFRAGNAASRSSVTQTVPVRIRATSVFERVVYHCHCIDPADPSRPMLEVEAVLREGDADGPLLVAVADFKRMLGFATVASLLPHLRDAGRTERRDGVEYVAFPMWQTVE
jgi:hypothetical protein